MCIRDRDCIVVRVELFELMYQFQCSDPVLRTSAQNYKCSEPVLRIISVKELQVIRSTVLRTLGVQQNSETPVTETE